MMNGIKKLIIMMTIGLTVSTHNIMFAPHGGGGGHGSHGGHGGHGWGGGHGGHGWGGRGGWDGGGYYGGGGYWGPAVGFGLGYRYGAGNDGGDVTVINNIPEQQPPQVFVDTTSDDYI